MFLLGLEAVEESVIAESKPVTPQDVSNAYREVKREERDNQHLKLQTMLTIAAIGTLIVTIFKGK